MPDIAPVEAPSITRAPVAARPVQNETATQPAPPAVESPIITQDQVLEGGSTTKEVVLDEKATWETADVITRRLQALTSLKARGGRLTPLDNVILSGGQALAERLNSGRATAEDFSASRAILRDELIQRAVATGHLVKDKPGWMNNARRIPIVGMIADAPESELTGIGFSEASAYLEEIGFSDWSPERIEKTLLELNDTRRVLELSMYGKGFRDKLFDETSNPLFTPDFARQTGDRFNDETVKQLRHLVEQRHPGENFGNIWNSDQKEAVNLLLEANGRTLTQVSSEMARQKLSAEKPAADAELIESQAKKLEQPPKAEELEEMDKKIQTAESDVVKIKTELEQFKTTLKTKRDDLRRLQNESTGASELERELVPELDREISHIESEMARIDGTSINPPTGLSPQQEALYIQKQQERLQEERSMFVHKRNEAVQERFKLIRDRIKTKIDLGICQEDIKYLEGDGTTPGRVAETEAELQAKEKPRDEAVKAKKDRVEQSPEKSKALRAWKDLSTAENYERIMGTVFSQGNEDEFTVATLSNPEVENGQIMGAEKFREHVFQLIEGADYRPELARKMLSDETLGAAIIYSYGIDILRGTPPLSDTLRDISVKKQDLERARVALSARPRNAALQALLKTAEDAYFDQTRRLLYSAFSEVKQGNRFQVADTLRFIINQGLKSAQRGEPYLEIEERFIR